MAFIITALSYLLFILASSLVVLFEISFLSVFSTLRMIDLSLIVFVFVMVFAGIRWGAIAGVTMGILLDVFSPLSFGGYIIAIFVIMGVLIILIQNVFTDRHIFSLLSLGVVATILFHLTILLFSFLTTTFDIHPIGIPLSWRWVTLLGNHFLLNLVTLFALYAVGDYVHRSFARRFLVIRS